MGISCKPFPTISPSSRLSSTASGKDCKCVILLTRTAVTLYHSARLDDTSLCLCFSYLFPDGRTQNPDLTGLCEPSPQDHIKVTQVSISITASFLACCFYSFTLFLPFLLFNRSNMSSTAKWARLSSCARSVLRMTRM